jgi:hypothetical protein
LVGIALQEAARISREEVHRMRGVSPRARCIAASGQKWQEGIAVALTKLKPWPHN